jgi:hypothetical protein
VCGHRTAGVKNRHEVARRLDPPIVPPHISNDVNIKGF